MNTEKQELALAATQALRKSDSFSRLPASKQHEVNHHLMSIERHLVGDPYAAVMETPRDFHRRLSGVYPGAASGNGNTPDSNQNRRSSPAPSQRLDATQTIGTRVADTLEAVDFPGFVAGLVTGTFQAIVDATIQQLHEYADLIANLSKTVDEFARDNVSRGQARQRLLDRHHSDLLLSIPGPGEEGSARLIPHPQSEGQSPSWLTEYGLEGQTLCEELTEGALLSAGIRAAAEERLQTLATMVLLGINRIVVNEGHVRAKMQFHAVASDKTTAEIANLGAVQKGAVSQRYHSAMNVAAQVSTVKANAQAQSGIRTDLMGEVHIVFGTETFPLERFAEGPLVEVINRHARWRPEGKQTSRFNSKKDGSPTSPREASSEKNTEEV